jgi:hypothetical protein
VTVIITIYVRFIGTAGVQMGGQWHCTSRGIGKGKENHELGTGFLCIRESYQQLRALRLLVMSYIILISHWCHIIALNVHAPTEDKTDDMTGSFYEELECVLDKFPKDHMKMLLGDIKATEGREWSYSSTLCYI